jgi:hypothetical protein
MADTLGIGLFELAHLLDPSMAPSMNGHEVPKWLSHYESLVQAAGRLSVIDKGVIPHLLQTSAYSAAIERYGPLLLTDEQVTERVGQRIARQSVLHRERAPLELVVLISEQVLLDTVGSADVMVEQLSHLLALVERRNVDVRLLPTDGRAACAHGGFEMLYQGGETRPFMVTVFGVGGPAYVEDPLLVPRYVDTFDFVLSASSSPDESTRRIREIREAHRQ